MDNLTFDDSAIKEARTIARAFELAARRETNPRLKKQKLVLAAQWRREARMIELSELALSPVELFQPQ
jgi:hypothetical protein